MHIVVLTNILSPYRIPVFRELAKRAGSLEVLYTGVEDVRQWRIAEVADIRARKLKSIVISYYTRGFGLRRFDKKYLHLPLNIFGELKRSKPDGIFSAEMGLRTLLAAIYAKMHGVPLVVHWGGTLHTERNVGLLKRLVRKRIMVKLVPAWASFGSSSREYLESIGVPSNRIKDAFNCVDNGFFARECKASLSLGPKPVLLYVGRFLPIKGLDLFLRAAAALQSKGHTFSVLLVGGGEEDISLRAKAAELDLQDIHFHPFVQQDELPGIYRSADILVFPSLQDVWGLVVNEALASNLPVLCSRYAGCAHDIVPESSRFDPLDLENSFIPALENALLNLPDGSSAYLSGSELPCPEFAAETILELMNSQVRPR